MKSKFNKPDTVYPHGSLREQPEMAEPKLEGDTRSQENKWEWALEEYLKQKAACRTIPCSENNWKDGQELEEGKDYVVRFQTDVNIAEDLVAVPIVAQETEDLSEAMELIITDYEELVNKLYPKKDRELYLPCLQRARKSLHKSIQRRKQ